MVTEHFAATVIQSHGKEDTLEILRSQQVDLVTINRKLDRDYSDGLEIAKAIRAEAAIADVPIMLVTNFEEHQQLAIAAGCVRGFGKLAINEPATKEALAPYLGSGA